MTRQMQSDYMDFAKFGADARYNLATSGVASADLADLGLTWSDLALHGPNAGGYAPLVETVAARFGVDPACVVMPGGGASFAPQAATTLNDKTAQTRLEKTMRPLAEQLSRVG